MNKSNKMLAVFFRKLGLMIEAGLPLLKTLNSMKQDLREEDPFRKVIADLAEKIKEGSAFKEALAKHPEFFSPTVLVMVETGELTGALEKCIAKVAAGYESGAFGAGEMGGGNEPEATVHEVTGDEDKPGILKVVSAIIHAAHKNRANGIHIDYANGNMRIRYRIDGVLHPADTPPPPIQQAVVDRFKLMASIDVNEKRLPRDGRIRVSIAGKEVDLRVSTVPCANGESIVLRILDKQNIVPALDQIGFTPENRAMLTHWLKRPSGLILTTGPTGSGKTTLLYACLKELNQAGSKIMTVEDPVEYLIDGVDQVPTNHALGITFSSALRCLCRQDPDVIMIGETRDLDTAALGVHTALTGHLVLSSLHTNDAPSALRRMLDIGIDPYLLNSTLVGVCALRLVRMVCKECREEYQPEGWIAELTKSESGLKFYRGKGCPACRLTGYNGRTAIHEMLEMNDKMRTILARDPAHLEEFRAAARESGMLTLREDGFAKARQGLTTVEEVLRVVACEM